MQEIVPPVRVREAEVARAGAAICQMICVSPGGRGAALSAAQCGVSDHVLWGSPGGRGAAPSAEQCGAWGKIEAFDCCASSGNMSNKPSCNLGQVLPIGEIFDVGGQGAGRHWDCAPGYGIGIVVPVTADACSAGNPLARDGPTQKGQFSSGTGGVYRASQGRAGRQECVASHPNQGHFRGTCFVWFASG